MTKVLHCSVEMALDRLVLSLTGKGMTVEGGGEGGKHYLARVRVRVHTREDGSRQPHTIVTAADL